MNWRRRLSSEGALDALLLAAIAYVVLWSLHPSLVFSSSLLTGGDTGSHVELAHYLVTQHTVLNWTPWYPGWFAGMPAYTYYFVLPDLLAAWASHLIGFAVAFKLTTIFGSLLTPVTAYAMGRLFRAPRPVPLALAFSTLPFLFDASFTIDGGNLFSTMAGEYAFSLSLALSMLTIGLFARGLRTGHGYWKAALALSATLAAHVLPWFFAIVAVVVMVVFELAQRRGLGDPRTDDVVAGDYARPLRFALGAGLLSGALSAWWLLPFVTEQSLTNSMGYVNDNVSSLHAVFTVLGWFTSAGGAAGDRWVIVLATVAAFAAFVVRDRLGMVLATLASFSLLAFVLDPQSVIWNERLVPFWFLTIHLLAGWLVGYVAWRVAQRRPSRRALANYFAYAALGETAASDDASVAALDDAALDDARNEFVVTTAATRRRRATLAIAILGLLSTVPGLIVPLASRLHLSTTGNQVTSWSEWNYSGYQAKPAWPEYHDLMTTMGRVARRYGCGRAMWEYSADQNRFGTPMALMLLPYWTNGCVDSMEGLYFESSATTPYHFLDQSELSLAPSDPQVGLNYPGLNVAAGVRHLQMLGVRYYVAFSPSIITQANADPQLTLVASTRAWPAPGVRWRIYLIHHSPLVVGLTHLPNVVAHLSARVAWLNANVTWWLNPRLQGVYGAETGPANWPRANAITSMRTSASLARVTVRDVRVASQDLSFDVSRVGVPVLVKISYFPRWHAIGATGPYRVSPNLMVVVPTSRRVRLVYGSTPALTAGNLLSDLAVVGGLSYAGAAWWRRKKHA
ncbi:MAG: hypothetical protein KGJ42_02695 [Acidobacteriota bacterium]|nr:hypothetical protein [Acidobacteriota bacterium]